MAVKDNKLLKKYLNYIMTDDVKTLSRKFAQELDNICGDKNLYRNNIDYSIIFKAKNRNDWLNALNDILIKTNQKNNKIMIDVIDYLFSDISNEDFKTFLIYSKFHSNIRK